MNCHFRETTPGLTTESEESCLLGSSRSQLLLTWTKHVSSKFGFPNYSIIPKIAKCLGLAISIYRPSWFPQSTTKIHLQPAIISCISDICLGKLEKLQKSSNGSSSHFSLPFGSASELTDAPAGMAYYKTKRAELLHQSYCISKLFNNHRQAPSHIKKQLDQPDLFEETSLYDPFMFMMETFPGKTSLNEVSAKIRWSPILTPSWRPWTSRTETQALFVIPSPTTCLPSLRRAMSTFSNMLSGVSYLISRF